MALAVERPVGELTPAEIAARAGVNRSTFYQYHASRDAQVVDLVLGDLDGLAITRADLDLIKTDLTPPPYLVRYFEIVAAKRSFYEAVLSPPGSGSAVLAIQGRIMQITAQGLADPEAAPVGPVPLDVATAAIAGSVLAVLMQWLAGHPDVPAPVAAGWAWQALVFSRFPELREQFGPSA